MTVAAASDRPLLLVVPVFTNAVFANLVMTNCMGLAMEHARGLPGAGSAVLGLLMFAPSSLPRRCLVWWAGPRQRCRWAW